MLKVMTIVGTRPELIKMSRVIAEFDPSGNLLLYSNTQVPFLHKREFAELLGIDPGRIRIVQPPIGGGFGSKLDIYPFEPICILLAKATRTAAEALGLKVFSQRPSDSVTGILYPDGVDDKFRKVHVKSRQARELQLDRLFSMLRML